MKARPDKDMQDMRQYVYVHHIKVVGAVQAKQVD
jgi:hypothetical protein